MNRNRPKTTTTSSDEENIIIIYCYTYGGTARRKNDGKKALNGTNAPAVGPGKSDSADRSRSRITLRLHFADGRICQTNERRSVNRIRRRSRRVVGFFSSRRLGNVINMCIIIGRYIYLLHETRDLYKYNTTFILFD